MEKVDVQKIRSDYDKLKASLMATAPFINSLLTRARIVLYRGAVTAGVSKEGVIAINPEFWNKLGWKGKCWVLAHEVFHLAFRDHKRIGSREIMAWNFCADAVNNELQQEMVSTPKELQGFIVIMRELWYPLQKYWESLGLDNDAFIKLSKEEVYKILPKHDGAGAGKGKEGTNCPKCGSDDVRITELDIGTKKAKFKCDKCGHEWDGKVEFGRGSQGKPIPIDKVVGDLSGLEVDESEGVVIQDGDPNVYKDGEEKDGDEVTDRWKENVAKAYDMQKTIGTVPAGLKRIVEDLLKPKIDWRSINKQAFRMGFGRTVISSYRRPSRKSADFPGTKRYTLPTVWCLLDQSGSISDKEATQYLSEVYDIAGNSKVAVMCWDAEIYGVVEAGSKQQVISNVLGKLRGGGGTVVAPCLKETLKRMKNKDIVVLFSDFDISDIGMEETKRLFSAVSARSSVSVLVSTHTEVDMPGWRYIKMVVD